MCVSVFVCISRSLGLTLIRYFTLNYAKNNSYNRIVLRLNRMKKLKLKYFNKIYCGIIYGCLCAHTWFCYNYVVLIFVGVGENIQT